MIICVCERDSNGSDQNHGMIDTEKLQAISKSDSKNKDLAKEWISALTSIYAEFLKKGRCFTAQYKQPSDYCPREARVEKFPITISLCCEVWIG